MSLEYSPGRETRRRHRRVRVDVERAAYTVRTFCDSHEISRTFLYELWREGRGPRFFWLGDQRRISVEAATEWRAAMEDDAEVKLEAVKT